MPLLNGILIRLKRLEIWRHEMSVTMRTCEELHPDLRIDIPGRPRVLIACDDDHDAKRLKPLLSEAGFAVECVRSITAACEAAKSGRFQVVICKPQLRDGSWRRLTELASHYDLSFVVVVWAHTFDLRDWAEALDNGAFDVLDAVYDLPRVVEVVKGASWAAFLLGAAPIPGTIVSDSHKVA
jgi:PleD family two-component response regulator